MAQKGGWNGNAPTRLHSSPTPLRNTGPSCVSSMPSNTPPHWGLLSAAPPPGLSSPPPASSFWHTHLLAAGVHGHLLPCRPALLTLLPLGGYNIADQDHVTGAPGFQGDGVHPEVLEHIENGLEPQVLHPAVTLLIQRQAQVLGGEGGGFEVGAPVDCSVSPARWDPEVEPGSPWPCPGS